MTPKEKAEALRALHARGRAFVIPNPWDVGSARLLAALGFEALATTSVGLSFSRGERLARVGREETLAHCREIVAATDLPVSADLENGFGDRPEDAAETIRGAIASGLAGGSIEDASGRADDPIYDLGLAVEKVRATAEAVRGQEVPFQLVARAENFLFGRPDLADTIRRLQAFQEAGADVLYAPGLSTADEVRAVVSSVDRPVNVVMGLVPSDLTVADLDTLGVARISIGSALARRAYGAVLAAGREMLEAGTFGFALEAAPLRDLEAMF
ncbi:MAG: isocitrate lyase/PEP mutase family protein [Pseudomonadota bacterium]